jgi:guanylate kinase
VVLYILAAVSGTGESTIARELIARNERLRLSVSHTTRRQREGERDGVHYNFVDRIQFDHMVREDDFAEWAQYVGNAYGTAKTTIQDAVDNDYDLLFDIEIQGARQLKAQYPEAVMVFLLPPSWTEVERRLRFRGTDNDEVIAQRLKRGRIEMEGAREFDFLVTNDNLEKAISAAEHIYRASRLRCAEAWPRVANLLGSDLG